MNDPWFTADTHFGHEKIIGYCEDAGVSEHLLLPGRNPLTRRAYGRSDEEKKVMKKIGEKAKTGYGTRVEMETYQAQRYCEQNLNFEPCPSGFIFTLVGSDGKVYKCTDNRGKDSMMLGQIKKPGDFEKFWHSEERVKRQIETPCKNQGCGRYAVNSRLDACRNCYSVRGVDFSEDFEILNSGDIIYI